MAFIRKKDTGGGEIFKFDNVGATLTGVYLGVTEHNGDYGPTNKYMFKTKEGTRVVFGSTHIDELLHDENPGQLMRLSYVGNKPTKRGKPMKRFELDIDDSYEASASEIEAAQAAVDTYEAEAGAEEANTVTPPVKPPVNATAPNNAARSKVEAMLAKNRKTG